MTNKTLVRIRVWIRAWIKIYIRTRNYYPSFGKKMSADQRYMIFSHAHMKNIACSEIPILSHLNVLRKFLYRLIQ